MGSSSAPTPNTVIQLTISCKGLKKKSKGLIKSKPNPCVFVYLLTAARENEPSHWLCVGHTEMIKDEVNPRFNKIFTFDYYFEKAQKLAFVLVNITKEKEEDKISEQKYMGYCEAPLGQIISSGKYAPFEVLVSKLPPPEGIDVKLSKKKPKHEGKYGKFSICVEELEDTKNTYNFAISCRNLDKKDKLAGSSDPYVTVSKKQMDGTMLEVYSTEVVHKDLNPTFQRFSLNAAVLCNCNRDMPLLWQVRDWNKNGDVKFIGQFEASLNTIMDSPTKEFELIYEKKKLKHKDYVNSGILVFTDCSLNVPDKETTLPPSFYDFISTGTEIKLTIGIDMSASNGGFSKARIDSCLHRLYPDGRLNDYQKTIKVIGSVLEAYDSDKLIPVFGFGCKVDGKVEQCWPINENDMNPEIDGIESVLEVYEYAIRRVQFSGPTTFAELINLVGLNSEGAIDGSIIGVGGHENHLKYYNILLIITDGDVTSFRETLDAIVNNSGKAMSIIIVGVGDCNFTDMNILDSDNKKLVSSSGKEADRDMVNFIQLNKYRDDSPAELSQAVLNEIPNQLQTFVNKYRIVPYDKDHAKLHPHLQSIFDLSE
ncbi:Copine-domain-containing protein [Anaeromyces robustus]|uniref:Copine-domain-containing protein n=1 Tax=Anaeromyces robustus TaxID=1754192 RepID=A0A1Y1X2A8_9FUNG|nr:Copine-domain-containing protein [Anaeromyces robustus]|eukprot:ORX79768.1 Copine-domain-containing protein [Anaeromyces robustus]